MDLIIIDLQDYFLTQFDKKIQDRLLATATDEIRKAREADEDILVVNYHGCGEESEAIYRALLGYEKVSHIVKNDDDGFPEIEKSISENKIKPKAKSRVCGVNTTFCVGSTVLSMMNAGYEPKLIWDGVDCCQPRNAQRAYIESCNISCKW